MSSLTVSPSSPVEPITGPNGLIVPLQTQAQAILNLVGASNRLGTECAAAYPGAEAWKVNQA